MPGYLTILPKLVSRRVEDDEGVVVGGESSKRYSKVLFGKNLSLQNWLLFYRDLPLPLSMPM